MTGWLGRARLPARTTRRCAREALRADATSAVVGQLALHEGVLCYEIDDSATRRPSGRERLLSAI
jgi:hypothetical protein